MKNIAYTLFIVLSLQYSVLGQVDNYSGGYNGQKFDWFLYYLENNYVDSLNTDSLTEMALRRVVKELDPWSRYQSKEDLQAQLDADKGYSGKGIGFSYYFHENTAIVTYINRDGPADIAGLKRGDLIISCNNIDVTGDNSTQFSDITKSETIDNLHLEIKRKGVSQKLIVVKNNVPWFSIHGYYMIDDKNAYIKIGTFTIKAMEEFSAALSHLKSLGAVNLILDLRGNMGGVRDQSLLLADAFLPVGKLVNYAQGVNMPRTDYISAAAGQCLTGKVVLLQDGKSASASEIFISALQENDRAIVMGKSTYGKGLIQQSYLLGDSSSIRLTIGKYYTPTGRHIQRIGSNEEDWLRPYLSKLNENAFTAQLDIGSEYQQKTLNDRTFLAGPGGIIPDIYYQAPHIDYDLYNKLNNASLLYPYAVKYVHDYRELIYKNYNGIKAFINDKTIDRNINSNFGYYVEDKRPEIYLPRTLPDNIMNQLKTWMASQLWEDNAYYEMKNQSDNLIERAVEVIDSKIFDNMNISY